MSKTRKVYLKYIPQLTLSLVSTLAAIFVIGLSAKTYTWIKSNGDFATTTFVMQAKAECYEQVDKKIADHKVDDRVQYENIQRQLTDLNGKMDKILLREYNK